MKAAFSFSLGKAAALVVVVAFSLWAQPAAAGSQAVKLNAGEAYVIKGVDADSTPEVRFSDNPNAFSVQSRSASELLVLGVQAGKGTIKVRQGGEAVSYEVTVAAIAAPGVTLAPAKGPAPTISDSKLSGERERAAEPGASVESKLDTGAGPARSETKTELVKPAAAESPLAAAKPESAAPSAPGTGGGAMYAATEAGSATAAGGSTVIPSQKFTSNPPAEAAVDSLEREPAVGGRHYLSTDAISMMTGTSRVYDFVAPIRRVSIADSKIADIQVINPHQLMLVGHDPGFTTLVVWDGQGHYEERQVRIEKEGHQQVLLNVVVAEINRSKIEQQGIDYSVAFAKYGLSWASLPGNVATPFAAGGIAPPGGNPFPLLLSSNITYALSAQNSDINSFAFFKFLEDNSLGRILAQPRLLANSGEEAKFLSGGEIPIVIAQALNTSVVFKQFGTSVVFLPTVVGKHDIELVVKPEVSKPDFAQGVQLFGFTVPAFVTRRAETAVRMQENQTLIIAGLILDDTTSQIRKVPYLGDIPYAGALFRHTAWQHVKTELVMSVTPQIVRPIPTSGELVLPTERAPMTRSETRTKPLERPDVTRQRLY
jgi:Flp pilus assembly secretin CpaC